MITTLDQYQNAAIRTLNRDLDIPLLKAGYALGLSGEADELIVSWCEHGKRFAHTEENGDCLWYLATLAHLYGWPLSHCIGLHVEAMPKLLAEFGNVARRNPIVDFARMRVVADSEFNVTHSVYWSVYDFTLFLRKRVGALTEVVKKRELHGHEQGACTRENIGRLIGSVAVFLASQCDLQTAANANAEKLAKRYPAGFSSADSIARADKAGE